MNYNNLFQKSKTKNITNLEILEQTIESLAIDIFDENLNNYEVSNLTQYTIKGTYNNKLVTISTEQLDDTILDKIIKNSIYLEDEPIKNPQPKEKIIYQEDFIISNSKSIIEKLLRLNNLKKKYPHLKNLNTTYTETISQIKIITEDNLEEDIKKIYRFEVEAIAIKEDQKSTFANSKNSTQNNIDIESLTETTIQEAISKLDCGNISSGIYNVLLTNKVVAQILNCFIPIFTSESIQKHTSLLEGKLNKQVFSSKITIIEDPSNKDLIGKRLFDNTGIKTTYKEIIQEGIFKNILYDEKTAIKDNTTTTGNDYGTISVRNMYLKPGIKPKDAILENQEEYIIIDTVHGLHAGVNITNGNISLQSDGYLVKKDKKIPIKLFILSTNIIELLNNVSEIANDLENISSTVSAPSIFVNNLKISI